MAGAGFHLYVTFSGEASKTASAGVDPQKQPAPIAHVRAYDASGKQHARVTPDYDELRGMALDAAGQFYLAVAHKTGSEILAFAAAIGADGYSRALLGTAVSPASSIALDHPYGLTFDGDTLFVSNQDTNVVAAYGVPVAGFPAATLAAASSLTSTFPGTFYAGTYVASAQPVTVGGVTPPAVPAAQGGLTMTGFGAPAGADDAAKPPARHSVRGVLVAGGTLYVADEAGARVAMYDPATGAFLGSLTTTTDGAYTLSTPVGLAADQASGRVYIGDPGNDAIFAYHPSSKKLETVVDKKSGGDAVKKVSGLAVGSDGTLFFASREAQAISTVDKKGTVAPFVTGLPDTPECLLFVAT